MSFPEPKLIKNIIEYEKNDNIVDESHIDHICMTYMTNKYARKTKINKGHIKIKTINDTEIQCVICLDNFVIGQYKKNLCCGHVFHKKCIDLWLCDNDTCPTCRHDIT
jgi:hypothetical protein